MNDIPKKMSSVRPYQIRSIHEWIIDNSMTPYITVDCLGEGVSIPQEHVVDGKITLNIRADAVSSFTWDNTALALYVMFNHKPQMIHVPMGCILAIFAKETGAGLYFEKREEAIMSQLPKTETKAPAPQVKKPVPSFLSVVK